MWRSLGGSSREVSARDGSVIERFGDEAQSVLPWASLVKLIEPNHWARHRKRTVSNAGAGRGEGWEDSRQDAAQERGTSPLPPLQPVDPQRTAALNTRINFLTE